MAHSHSSLQDLIDKKISTDLFKFPYNETPDEDAMFSKESKEYPTTDVDFPTTALDTSYSEEYPITDVNLATTALDISYSEEYPITDVNLATTALDSSYSEEYPITDVDFPTTALDASYPEINSIEAPDLDATPSEQLKGIVNSNASMHRSLGHILEYISKPRQRVQQYVPPSNSHSEAKELLDLVRYPDRRQRQTFAGHDSANISIDDMHSENEEFIQLLTCIICCTNRRCVVFIPCGHLVVCSDCKDYVGQQCPMCREKIGDKKECLYE